MGILSKLFGKKENRTVKVEIHPVYGDWNEVSNFISEAETMVDCKVASEKIDELVGYFDVQPLREELCDKTFEVYKKEYTK